jgi:hypothetical protein
MYLKVPPPAAEVTDIIKRDLTKLQDNRFVDQGHILKKRVPYTFVRFLNLKIFFSLEKEQLCGNSWIFRRSLGLLLPSARPSNPGRASKLFRPLYIKP